MGWPGECGHYAPGRAIRQSFIPVQADIVGLSTDYANQNTVPLASIAADQGPQVPVNAVIVDFPGGNSTQGTTPPTTTKITNGALQINEAGVYTIQFHGHFAVTANGNYARTNIYSLSGLYGGTRLAEGSGVSDVYLTWTGALNNGDILWFGCSQHASSGTASGTNLLAPSGQGSGGPEGSYVRILRLPLPL